MSVRTREELIALEDVAREAAGLTLDDAPRVCASGTSDGGVEFSFSGPPPASPLLAHVVVDSDGNATVTPQ